MPFQMPHVSVCDSHNSLPQSEHCMLAVLEQGSPSSSAEFLTSMTSQLFGMEEVYCSYHKCGAQNLVVSVTAIFHQLTNGFVVSE